MWSARFSAFVFFGFVQLLVLADVLNERARALATPDVDWAGVFAPLIVYAALCFLFIAATLVQAVVLALSAPVGGGGDARTPASPYGNTTSVLLQRQRRKRARILAWDALFDLLLLTLLAVALGLAIDQLERADDSVAGNERSWANSVLVPIYIALALLGVLIGVAALRTSGEERYQRPLSNRELLTASFGDVVLCCSVDEQQINEAERQRYDKRPEYAAIANFHSLPCAFLCAPALAFGAADVLLSWLLYLALYAALGVLVAVGFKADGSAIVLHNAFAVLYALGGLVVLCALGTLLSLFCCYARGADKLNTPNGRSVLAKAYELLLLLVLSSALIAQLALLANRIDGASSADNWHFVFLPLYLALSLLLLTGVASIVCCRDARGARRTTVDVRGGRAPMLSDAAAAVQYAPRTHGGASSHWGVFE